MCDGVPAFGLHRESKSGRGLPTAFFIKSVMKEVRSIAMKNDNIVT